MSFTQSYFYPTIITNITQLNGGLYGTVKPTDVYPAVDTTDVTQSPYGTTKPYQLIALFNYIIVNLGYIVYQPVLAATTANLLSTYNNGISGVGATLTNSGTQTAFVLDDQTGVQYARYLIKNQTAPEQNGIYILSNIGSNTTNWVLTRSIDFNTSLNIFENGIVFVIYGTANSDTFWQDSYSMPLTVGTTAINWATWIPGGSGSGTVNAGNQNDLAWYPTTGTAVSGLPTAANSVLVTDNSGVPSLSRTLPSSLLIPSPKIGTGLFDSNGNEILALNPGASAVNFIAIGNTATTLAPQIAAVGSDTNITFSIASKGTGNIVLGAGSGGLNTILELVGSVASPVNFLAIAPAATTGKPVIQAVGSDINIGLIVSGQGTSGVLIKGATDGVAIPAGYIGETITVNVPFASSISLTTSTAADITSIDLLAGNWRIDGNVFFNFPSNTGSSPDCWISTTSATLPDLSHISIIHLVSSLFVSVGMVAPSLILNISSPTTVYLSGGATFASGTGTACGTITATRIS
jgi:hypothetical protein